jgi:tRNA(Ile)-lysidine synthase
VTRLAALVPAVQRRLLRYAAEQLGAAPDFLSTEALRALALTGRAGQRCELAQGLRAERTPRELRLKVGATGGAAKMAPEYSGSVPGEIAAPVFGLRLRIEAPVAAGPAEGQRVAPGAVATMRNWRPGDRVRLRHSGGPRKVKEVLERLRVTGSKRALWPVLEVEGRILWMQGVELEPEGGIDVTAKPLEGDAGEADCPEPSGSETFWKG